MMPWRIAFIGLALSTGAAAAAPLSERMQCIRDNLPDRWVARMSVQAVDVGGGETTHTLVYADRRQPAARTVETSVQFLAPESLRGVAHLYRQRGDDRQQYSYLPVIGKVREVTGAAAPAAVLEGVPGLADLEALWRWPERAAISLGSPGQADGHAVQAVRANRRVGEGDAAGFERFEGQLDLRTCLITEARLYAVDGTLRQSMRVDRRSLQAFGPRWLPRRIELLRTADGGRAVVTLDAIRIDPPFPDASFDPRRFHQAPLAVMLTPR